MLGCSEDTGEQHWKELVGSSATEDWEQAIASPSTAHRIIKYQSINRGVNLKAQSHQPVPASSGHPSSCRTRVRFVCGKGDGRSYFTLPAKSTNKLSLLACEAHCAWERASGSAGRAARHTAGIPRPTAVAGGAGS